MKLRQIYGAFDDGEERSQADMLKPSGKVSMVILAAKLAKETLDLITMNSADLCKLQFRQIVIDLKALDDHIKTL